MMDDVVLHKRGIFRLGNILIPKASYSEILEDKIQPILQKLVKEGKRSISSHELVLELGKKKVELEHDDLIVEEILPLGVMGGIFGSYSLYLEIEETQEMLQMGCFEVKAMRFQVAEQLFDPHPPSIGP